MAGATLARWGGVTCLTDRDVVHTLERCYDDTSYEREDGQTGWNQICPSVNASNLNGYGFVSLCMLRACARKCLKLRLTPLLLQERLRKRA